MPQFDSIRFQPSRPLLKEVTADRLNTILSEIRRVRPKGERGITVRHTGDGTFIGLAAALKGASGSSQTKPFDIYVVNSANDTYTLKVRPGTISLVLADNWDEEFTVNKDELIYGIATITTDGRAITGMEIDMVTEPPEQQEPAKFALPSEVQIQFGLFRNGVAMNLLQRSPFLYAQLALVTSPDPPAAPGESPFDLWFTLAEQ